MTRPLISLIVPVWGDDDLLAALVNRLPSSPELLEWVVAAVDPSATLRELEHRGDIRLVPCVNPSRGRQLNAGAAEAHGLLLCFHHADSELLPEHVSALVKVAADEAVGGGAFHRKFDNRHCWMMRWEAAARGLCSVAGPLFGDQSIFVRADVFKRLGGFRRYTPDGRCRVLESPAPPNANQASVSAPQIVTAPFPEFGELAFDTIEYFVHRAFLLGDKPKHLASLVLPRTPEGWRCGFLGRPAYESVRDRRPRQINALVLSLWFFDEPK